MGGEIVKIAKGNFIIKAKNITNYSGGDINKIAGKKHIKTFEEMICGDAKEAPQTTIAREIPAKVIVHFRPNSSWKGEFGFDWMRINDTKLFNDNKYEDIACKQYKTGTNDLEKDTNAYGGDFKKDATMYTNLKKEYNPHKIVWKKKKEDQDYFVPWLSLAVNKEAKLELIVDIEEEADTLEFINNENFTFTPNTIDIKGKKKLAKQKVTIKCIKEFKSDQTISIETHKVDASGNTVKKLAGKFKAWANDVSKQKIKKVLLIQLETNITGKKNKQGDATGEENRFKQYLEQAFVNTDVDTESLDLSTDAQFQKGGHYEKKGLLAAYYKRVKDPKDPKKTIDNPHQPKGYKRLVYYVYDKLKEQLKAANPKDPFANQKYDQHFIAIYLGENGGGVDKNGIVNKINGSSLGKYVLLFPSKNNQTAAHEFLHSLNLPHSFTNKEADSDALFTYTAKKTENLLDYTHQVSGHENDRCALWHWQWIKANNAV